MSTAASLTTNLADIPADQRVFGLKVIAAELSRLARVEYRPMTLRRRAARGRLTIEIEGKVVPVLYQDPLTDQYWAPSAYLLAFVEQHPSQAIGADDRAA